MRVNTPGRCLEASTSIGLVAVEIYWKAGGDPDGDTTQGDFFSALDPTTDPDAASNPLSTQRYPYTILPDGVLYGVAVRAPLAVAKADWSEARQETPINKSASIGGMLTLYKGGMTLAEFRQTYPGVEVGGVPEGEYTITATERTKPILALAARTENGEPLTRIKEIRGGAVRYRETFTGDFQAFLGRPEAAVAMIDSRTTIRGNDEADRQRLEFRINEERTGEGQGLFELIVLQGMAVEYTDFTFKPYEPPAQLNLPHNHNRWFDDGGQLSRGSKALGGLVGGETHYRAPETIKVSTIGVRDLRAIAAFRFAMAGTR